MSRIQSSMRGQEGSRTTYGVAEVRLPDGTHEIWTAGAGKTGYVRPGIRDDNIVVRDKTADATRINRHNDAEQALIRAAQNRGVEILAIGASRPICEACREQLTINNLTERAVTPFKDNLVDYLE